MSDLLLQIFNYFSWKLLFGLGIFSIFISQVFWFIDIQIAIFIGIWAPTLLILSAIRKSL